MHLFVEAFEDDSDDHQSESSNCERKRHYLRCLAVLLVIDFRRNTSKEVIRDD
jgi:uncharacterized iron-regulated protein